jgi:hypothetical protein
MKSKCVLTIKTHQLFKKKDEFKVFILIQNQSLQSHMQMDFVC